jgi:hypothetical protein
MEGSQRRRERRPHLLHWSHEGSELALVGGYDGLSYGTIVSVTTERSPEVAAA